MKWLVLLIGVPVIGALIISAAGHALAVGGGILISSSVAGFILAKSRK